MPTKEEIKSNKAEAKALRKTLTAANRANLKECAELRKQIRKAAAKMQKLINSHGLYTNKVNRRLAILEGRNEA